MNSKTFKSFLFVSFLTLLTQSQPTSSFFEFQQGTVPILLTAPHGGNLQPNDIENVRSGNNPGDVILNDLRTDRITDTMRQYLESQNLKPYVVINKISRRYVDLNRDKLANNGQGAYEDNDAEKYYDFYHTTIRNYINEIRSMFGSGILLDIHGQAQLSDKIIRGTKNGLTVTKLIQQFGIDSLIGDCSVFGLIENAGYPVEPNNVPFNVDAETILTGGYTVQTYGSNNQNGIDSIQIEIGGDYRTTQQNPNIWMTTGQDLGKAVKGFYDKYFKNPGYSGVLHMMQNDDEQIQHLEAFESDLEDYATTHRDSDELSTMTQNYSVLYKSVGFGLCIIGAVLFWRKQKSTNQEYEKILEV